MAHMHTAYYQTLLCITIIYLFYIIMLIFLFAALLFVYSRACKFTMFLQFLNVLQLKKKLKITNMNSIFIPLPTDNLFFFTFTTT